MLSYISQNDSTSVFPQVSHKGLKHQGNLKAPMEKVFLDVFLC